MSLLDLSHHIYANRKTLLTNRASLENTTAAAVISLCSMCETCRPQARQLGLRQPLLYEPLTDLHPFAVLQVLYLCHGPGNRELASRLVAHGSPYATAQLGLLPTWSMIYSREVGVCVSWSHRIIMMLCYHTRASLAGNL